MKKTSLETFCAFIVALCVLLPCLIYMALEKGFPWEFYATALAGCAIYLIVYHIRGGNRFDELTRMIEKENDEDKVAFFKGCREVFRDTLMGVSLVIILGLGAISVVLQMVDYLIPSIICALIIGYNFMALVKLLGQKIPEEPTVDDLMARWKEESKENARIHGF